MASGLRIIRTIAFDLKIGNTIKIGDEEMLISDVNKKSKVVDLSFLEKDTFKMPLNKISMKSYAIRIENIESHPSITLNESIIEIGDIPYE